MIDTFDRSGHASTASTFARAGKYACGLEDKPGRRIPKAGVYAEAGVGEAGAEWSVFDAKGASVSAGTLKARAMATAVSAMATAEVASASASAGPIKAKVGLAVDTGVEVGLTRVEANVLGTGFSLGRKMGVSLFGTGFSLDSLWGHNKKV
uniref:Uncharacterized protein n=1 Tax=Cyprinodon variegatus TaxID=28743 RepID=A0A3Q2CUB4_CYPVA